MKFAEEVMEILEAFDLTQSYRTAAQLEDCSPTAPIFSMDLTVARPNSRGRRVGWRVGSAGVPPHSRLRPGAIGAGPAAAQLER